MSRVTEGRAMVERMEELREDLKETRKRAEKRESWAAQEKVLEQERRIVDLFNGAGNAFQSAPEFERGNREARAALADKHWREYLR